MTEVEELRLAYAECSRQRNELLAKHKGAAAGEKRHRHEQSMWLIAGGYWMWCYQCGAIKLNGAPPGTRWEKPTGLGGINPAMKDSYKP